MVPQTVPGRRNLLKPKAVGSTVPGKPGENGLTKFAGRMCAGGTTSLVKTPDST